MTDHADEDARRRRRRTLPAALLARAIGALRIAGFESAWPAIERRTLTGDRTREAVALTLVIEASLYLFGIFSGLLGAFSSRLWEIPGDLRGVRGAAMRSTD